MFCLMNKIFIFISLIIFFYFQTEIGSNSNFDKKFNFQNEKTVIVQYFSDIEMSKQNIKTAILQQ